MLQVYLGTRRVIGVPEGSRAPESAIAPMVQAVHDFAEALAVFDERILAEHRNAKMRIWLSGGLARPFLFNAPDGASEADLRRIAAALASEQTGLEGDCEVWVEKSGKGGSRMAVAMQVATHQALLKRFGASKRQTLLSMRPWWADVLRASLRERQDLQGIAVQDCDALTMLTGQGDRFDSAQTMSPVFDQPTADAALMRRLLSMDIDAAAVRRARLVVEAGSTSMAVDVAMKPYLEIQA
ncbi:MAG TPA: hypothetical protein VGM81_09005 [Burkholderiaceae bacterium]|jgi:hypothetical protein